MTTTLNQQTGESTASRYTSVTTIHNEVGYSNNVEIIETALRERFGLNDNSYVLKAVAAHIWSSVCGTERATWNTTDVQKAIISCTFRLNKMAASLALKPVREADLSDAIAITKAAAAKADEAAVIKIPAAAIEASESLRADVLAHRSSIINADEIFGVNSLTKASEDRVVDAWLARNRKDLS